MTEPSYTIAVRDLAHRSIDCTTIHLEGPGMRNGVLIGYDMLFPDDDNARRMLKVILREAYEAGRAAKAKEIREAIAG